MVVGGGGCLNVNLVIGFGPNLGLELWPRAKPIKKIRIKVISTANICSQDALLFKNAFDKKSNFRIIIHLI